MSMFRRVGDIVSANFHDLVDQLEDPEKMLRQAIREMDDSIAGAAGAAARAIASERLLTKQVVAHQEQAGEWQARAERAVKVQNDELARSALGRKREHERLAGVLARELHSAAETCRTLERQLAALKAKHAEAKRMLLTLAGRQRMAEARKKVELTMAGPRPSAAFTRFERMRERVELIEAEAAALVDLQTSDEMLAEQVIRSEEQAAIEAELADIKQRLQRDEPPGRE